MLTLKKTMVAVLALGSSAVFAGSMGPVCSSVNVTVPCESTAWDFGAEALYLEAMSTSGNYTYIATDSTGKVTNFPNKWGWGFKLEGSYHYGTGSDTNLNWYHINKTSTRNLSGSYSYGAIVTPAGTVGSASVSPKWDAVNLEFGQHVDFGENKSIRFHGGVQYSRIANSVSLAGTDGAIFTASATRNPTYNGFGPRLGADMNYNWGNGLGIYANGAGTILVGTNKMSNSLAYSATLPTPTSIASSMSTSSTTIVPELETKLGIKYDYAMAQGDLTLDLGWMWVNYFNAQADVLSTGVDIVKGDFGLQGLYFGLKWLGNVA